MRNNSKESVKKKLDFRNKYHFYNFLGETGARTFSVTLKILCGAGRAVRSQSFL